MLERGLALDHVTIWRWVRRYAPVLNQWLEGERRRPNRCWPVDEACVRVAGNSVYRYRAVDLSWDVFDFLQTAGNRSRARIGIGADVGGTGTSYRAHTRAPVMCACLTQFPN